MMNFLLQTLDRGLQRNFLWQGKHFGRTLPSGDKSVKVRLIAERKMKKEEGREEKPSTMRNPTLLIECFLKIKRKEKITVKKKYKVGGLRPLQ